MIGFQSGCLTSNPLSPGLVRCEIALRHIFKTQKDRDGFDRRWCSFLASDASFSGIIEQADERINYLSEEIIPTKVDGRPPLLLLFGNPAPHSVKAGMMFSYEGNGREHRVWQVLREVNLLRFDGGEFTAQMSNAEKNQHRIRLLLSCEYDSPFRIALVPFYTLPTTSSAPPWSGVAGIWKLFGQKATEALAEAEANRIRHIVDRFMPGGGAIISFQKDAYRFLGCQNEEAYSLKKCLAGSLQYRLEENRLVDLYASPPTRLLRGKLARKALQDIIETASARCFCEAGV